MVMAAGRLSTKLRELAATGLAVLSMVKVKVLTPPSPITSGEKAMAKPGGEVMAVLSESLLLPRLTSITPALTDAVLVMLPVAPGAVTLIVIVGAAPMPRLLRVQVTVLPDTPQFQPVPEALTNPTPAGKLSVTVMLVAMEGPLLLTSSE